MTPPAEYSANTLSIYWRSAILVALFALVLAPLAAQGPTSARGRAAGLMRDRRLPTADSLWCYQIDLGAWMPVPAIGKDTIYIRPPRRIALRGRPDSAVAADSDSALFLLGRRVPAIKRRRASVHSSGAWHVVRPDSVELAYSTGFSGVVLYLRGDRNAWRGVAKSSWDTPRPGQEAPVALRPIVCGR